MTQNLDPLSLLAKRRAEMEAAKEAERVARDRLDAAAAERAKEEEELAIAERVIARLSTTATVVLDDGRTGTATRPAPEEAIAAAVKKLPPEPKKIPQDNGAPRPKGIPSVPQMVTDLLLEAETVKGLRGLTAPEIMRGIDAKWWPGVAVNLVMPTVYRCISKGFWFQKEGKLFVRLRGGQPPKRNSDQLRLDS